jgi:hypothetical protein
MFFQRTRGRQKWGARVWLHKLPGFGLFEIAISLSIVGLLSAGLYKGYTLLEKARMHRMASQIESVQVAYNLFKERYNALPGDWSDALGAEEQKMGNGNGVIEGSPLEPWSEASLFWHHLVQSGYLTRMSFAKSHNQGARQGVFVPKTPLGGGLFVRQNPFEDLPGVWLVIADPRDPDKPFLTPAKAQELDSRLDNGQPTVGSVRAYDAEGHAGECVVNDAYNVALKRRCCVLYVALDQ